MTKARGPFLKARTAAVLRLRELRAYVADRKGPAASAGKHNVLIFGQGRSGSTLLEHLLVSTGHFVGHHEVLNTVTREVIWPTVYVRGLGRAVPDQNIIVHVKPEHLGRARAKRGPVDARVFLEALVADGWCILHLHRQDILRQMVSKHIAKARGSYHKTDDDEETLRLKLPETEFIADYERRRGWLAQEDVLVEGLGALRLSYENDLEDPLTHQQTVDRILAELGLPSRPVSAQLRKIATGSPARFLENHEELERAFAARGWTWTL